MSAPYDREGCEDRNFEVTLKGEIITRIEGAQAGSAQVFIYTKSGRKFEMYHSQDCCECVQIRAVYGDVRSVIESELEIVSETIVDKYPTIGESSTLTVYHLSSAYYSDGLTIEWFGTSNGYYSESVSFIEHLT